MWNPISVYLHTVLILMQDWSTVCAELTIGLEIIFDALDGTPRCGPVMWNLVSVSLETMLVLVQDRWTVCAEHIIGLEIILDAQDATAR
jgi:hypothetical protein